MKSLQLQESSNEEVDYDLYDYVFGLFSIHDEVILNHKSDPSCRLEELSSASSKALKLIKSNKEITEYSNEDLFKALYKTERTYILNIASSFLNIDLEILSEDRNKIESGIILLAQKEIDYFDSVFFLQKSKLSSKFLTLEEIYSSIKIDRDLINNLFANKKEFELTLPPGKQKDDTIRSVLIDKFFNGDFNDYLKSIRKKIPDISKKVLQILIFLEMHKMTNEEISGLIKYLITKSALKDNEDINNVTYRNAKTLFESESWKYLIQDRKGFYSLIQSIREKELNTRYNQQILSENELQIITIFYWLKTSPKQSLKMFKHFNSLSKRREAFAHGSENNLILLLDNLEQSVSAQIKNKGQKTIADENLKSTYYETLCKTVLKETVNVCLKALAQEEKTVQDITNSQKIKKVKSFVRYIVLLILNISIISIALYSHWYFFDIGSIYSNNYLKKAKLSMETIPYFTELKDSADPIQNEIKQKQRLDYIKDLNSRYFKIFALFLNPSVSDSEIKNSLPLISIQEKLRDFKKIKLIRAELSNIYPRGKWNNIEYLIGLNVLTQLRAYGAICNFLLPSLAHYAIEDKNGLPFKINGKFQINNPTDEKELIRKDLIARFNKISNLLSIEPKFYITHYDETYKNISFELNVLLNKLTNKKTNIIALYKKTNSNQERENLKIILEGISVLEVRLNDLKKKILERRDCIIRNNTYRALPE